MKGLRFWSVVMALTWFLAGLGAGYLISSKKTDPSPWASFTKDVATTFQLDDRREYALNQVLSRFERRRGELKLRYEAEYHDAMEPGLRDLITETFDVIRNTIIPVDHRASFDEMLLPVPLSTRR